MSRARVCTTDVSASCVDEIFAVEVRALTAAHLLGLKSPHPPLIQSWHFGCSEWAFQNEALVQALADRANGRITMTFRRRSLPQNEWSQHINLTADLVNVCSEVVLTRDHDVVRRWAEARHAEPATGEATPSGPHTVHINDGGAGIRFNFPGAAAFRPISWDEWFENFDQHRCAFVFDNGSSLPLSNRYHIVNADKWKEALS
jgi:hypothetical protein